jgi:hypothetical protein
MALETRDLGPTLPEVPVPQTKLTAAGRRRLATASHKVDSSARHLAADRRAWAALVRELGIAACARELGITPQALSDRVKTIERAAAT